MSVDIWRGWRSLSQVARRLMAVRFLRSVAQGALAVDFTLYLKARHWSAPEIGLLLMAGGLSGALLSMVVGVASDRVGRRGFLLIYEIGLIIGTGALIENGAAWILAATAAIFGLGRGANGASGPFAPAEQAWLATAVPEPRRGKIFSFNAGLQFWGMGIGSLLAGGLPRLAFGLRGDATYLPVFGLNFMVAIINLLQIVGLPESRSANPESAATRLERSEDPVYHRENRALTRLALVNAVNSLGIGLVAPLLSFWFNLRFGVGPGMIGSVFGLTFFLTGLFSLMMGKLADRLGLMRSIVWPRLLGVAMLIAIPFMPNFTAAAILYVARSMVNRGSLGARQAFSLGLVRGHRRGFASSLNAVSWNVPAAVGPALGGWLIGLGSLTWPFVLAAGLQLAYSILFLTVMGGYESETELRRPTESTARAVRRHGG